MAVRDAAMTVGKTYADPKPGGPKFTVISADINKAVVRVEIAGSEAAPPTEQAGGGVCDDGSPFTAPGPETCEAPPIAAPAPDGGVKLDSGSTSPRDGGLAGSGGSGGIAGVLGGGLLYGKSLLAIVFDQVFHLTEEGWRKLTLRWALFFLALAVLNEIIWRTQSTDFWVAFKAFGVIPLTFRLRGAAIPAADETRREREEVGHVSRARRSTKH